MITFLQEIGKQARSIIGILIVLGTLTFDFFLYYFNIPDENKELAYTAAGGLNTLSAGVVAYYFGSSKDKSDQEKADIIEKHKE